MARIGFLSHADMSLYFFRSPAMRALKSLGHEIFAIAPDNGYLSRLASEFEVVDYSLDKSSLNPIKVLDDTKNLSQTLKKLNLDMLQTSAHKSNVFGTFAAKKAGIKVVINLVEGLGSFYIDDDIKTKFVRLALENLYKKSFSLANACIFVNQSDPNYMISKNLIPKDRAFIIKSVGIDSAKFDPNLYEKPKSDKKIILMMGRALWHKGIREFYEAAEILKDRDDCEFVFVGDEFKGNKSSANSEFLHSKYVKWLGWVDDTPRVYAGAYMFVLPSYKEGFPRTVLEAMSMAKPSVVSDCTGSNEAVIDGVNGLICKVKSSVDLAKKIEILLDDENLAFKMGQNARDLVLKNYDEKIVVQKYLEIYEKFIDV
ncbi:MAG: glycosyltransferase family 4 protein [Campylobacter sp.]|nr:glycosyltransferase family 4 protein [Campylobacter sp.]